MDLLAIIGWPVLDRIGPVSPHGLGIALGYLAGSWWMLREGRKRGLSEDHVGTILLWALIGAIVGARFFYVIGHLDDFESFVDMLKIWEGGISLIGGISGAIAFAYPFMRRFGYRFPQVMDSGAIGLAVGIFIGRIGDLIIGDHLGKPTDFLLGWQYKGGDLPGPWSGTEATGWIAPLERGLVQQITLQGATLCKATPDGFGCAQVIAQGPGVHQTALYDFLIAAGIFLFLRWLSRRPRREGIMIMSFAIIYGAGRVMTDFLRVDKTYFGSSKPGGFEGLTGSQITAIAVILLCLFTLWRFRRKPLPEAEPVAVGVMPSEGMAQPSGLAEGSTTDFEPPREPGTSEPLEHGTRPPPSDDPPTGSATGSTETPDDGTRPPDPGERPGPGPGQPERERPSDPPS